MFIIELSEGHESLDDIIKISCRLSQHSELLYMMTDEELKQIEYILAPTLDADQNEDEKRDYWDKLVESFVIENNGNPLRFHRDENTNRLYFGDEEGFKTIQGFVDRELNPDKNDQD